MKNVFLLLIIFFLGLSLLAQRIEYKSIIYDGMIYAPIVETSIYNYNTNSFAFSDDEGIFTILAQENDTLIFSKSGYDQLTIVLDRKEILLMVKEYFLFYKAVLLKEVQIRTLNPTYEGFKRDLVETKLPEVKITRRDGIGAEYVNTEPNLLRNTPLEHPITFLYNMFSKKQKAKRLYYEMLEYEDEVDKLPLKYNRDLVSQITGLEDENLMEFMVFCRFSYYDLVKWSEDEIIGAIKYKFSEYEYYKALNDE